MATSLTLASIESHVSQGICDALTRLGCDNTLLEQLSSPEGILRVSDRGNVNVRLDWYHNEDNLISGLFFRIYGENFVSANTFISDAFMHQAYIGKSRTFTYNNTAINTDKIEELFSIFSKPTHDVEVICSLEGVEASKEEQIKAFFERNPDMLPQPLRGRLFPIVAPPGGASESSGGAALATAGVIGIAVAAVFIAKKGTGQQVEGAESAIVNTGTQVSSHFFRNLKINPLILHRVGLNPLLLQGFTFHPALLQVAQYNSHLFRSFSYVPLALSFSSPWLKAWINSRFSP